MKIAARTSDVTRWRGLAIAAVAAGVIVGGLALRAPASRPLQLPHAQAKLACASCHDDRPIATHCTGCHGAHPSTRPGHAQLGCPTCHPAHAGGGVALAPDGTALRYGAGIALAAGRTDFHPDTRMNVPIPACGRCHADPELRFDEHRPLRDAAGTIAPRAAAWEAAREIAARVPEPAPSGGRLPWWWLGAGALAALAVLGGVRGADSLRKVPPPPPPPVAATRRLPVIDAAACLGCHACVDACPYEVLEVKRYVAQVARPDDCCGLTLCEQHCPNGSLVMGDPTAAPVAPALPPNLFLAGDVSGQPLIRTAIDQGTRAIQAIASRPRAKRELDVVIIGAGPAGLAAALEAAAQGLRYVVLEQSSIAESIRSFPRGKLVIDPDLPSPGRLWLAETSKEELLARWLVQAREAKLAIREQRRVVAIEPGFAIRDHTGEVHRAAHVVLAIGRRGTPRKLDVPVPETHVHYSLADARSFAGRRVLVVGLGDVAMEAAVALSRQPGTEVTVSYRGDAFHKGKARNIAEVRRRIAAGALRLIWRSEVTALVPGRATLATPDGKVVLPCDAVLVLIGQIASDDLLSQIVRAGEALSGARP